MSSFTRTIQRSIKRAEDDSDCLSPHFRGRGTKLGVSNPKDPCRTGRRKKPSAWRAKAFAPAPKCPLVFKPSPRPSKADLVAAHEAKMERKRRRSASVMSAMVKRELERRLRQSKKRALAQ